MIRSSLALLGIAGIVGVAAPTAPGATVSLMPTVDSDVNRYALTYTAAAGEANRLTVFGTRRGDSWTFRDSGAHIDVGANCAASVDGAVTCTAPASSAARAFDGHVVIDLGDADDVADVSALHSSVGQFEAGPGNDVLRVRSGFVSASMGPGDDSSRAESGGLYVEGGPGADTFQAGRRANVAVGYSVSAGRVRVTADGRANDGATGEHDDVSPWVRDILGSAHGDVLDARGARVKVSVSGSGGDDRLFASPRGGQLTGGEGDDVLRGGAGRDFLYGDLGDDELLAGGGADTLLSDSGRDLLVGGRGRDDLEIGGNARAARVRARDGSRDRIVCKGVPSHLRVDRTDRLTSCAFPVTVVADSRSTLHGPLRLTLRCPWLAPGGCRGRLAVFDSRPRPLGRARFTVAAGKARRVAVRLHDTPRDLYVAILVVNRRARPPASQRTTITNVHLVAP
jgi:hypothetical protein